MAPPSRKGAAIARRTNPTSSGSAAAWRARSVMVAPVVPQEMAASAMRTRPVSTVPHYTGCPLPPPPPPPPPGGGGKGGGGGVLLLLGPLLPPPSSPRRDPGRVRGR